MSIKSGQLYTMRNEENGMALDLYYSNNGSIIGHRFHGGETQQVIGFAMLISCPSYNHDTFQWITERQDDGQWTIRSFKFQKYVGLGFENTPKNGTPLFGVDKPQRWDIEILSDSDDHDNPRVRYAFITHPTGNGLSRGLS